MLNGSAVLEFPADTNILYTKPSTMWKPSEDGEGLVDIEDLGNQANNLISVQAGEKMAFKGGDTLTIQEGTLLEFMDEGRMLFKGRSMVSVGGAVVQVFEPGTEVGLFAGEEVIFAEQASVTFVGSTLVKFLQRSVITEVVGEANFIEDKIPKDTQFEYSIYDKILYAKGVQVQFKVQSVVYYPMKTVIKDALDGREIILESGTSYTHLADEEITFLQQTYVIFLSSSKVVVLEEATVFFLSSGLGTQSKNTLLISKSQVIPY